MTNQADLDRAVDILVAALQSYQQRNALKPYTTVSIDLEVKYSHDDGPSFGLTFRQGYDGSVESTELDSLMDEAQRRFHYAERVATAKQAFNQARLSPPAPGFDTPEEEEDTDAQ